MEYKFVPGNRVSTYQDSGCKLIVADIDYDTDEAIVLQGDILKDNQIRLKVKASELVPYIKDANEMILVDQFYRICIQKALNDDTILNNFNRLFDEDLENRVIEEDQFFINEEEYKKYLNKTIDTIDTIKKGSRTLFEDFIHQAKKGGMCKSYLNFCYYVEMIIHDSLDLRYDTPVLKDLKKIARLERNYEMRTKSKDRSAPTGESAT